MTTTVVGVFNSEAAAQSAVTNLRNAGIPMDKISVIARPSGDIVNERGEVLAVDEGHMTAGEGLTVGAVWGGLVGLAALAIPGIGPLVTSNIFAVALTGAVAGAATGGIAGALIDAASVPEEHARVYEDRVRAGGTLVTAQVDDSMAAQARSILQTAGAEEFNWDDPQMRMARADAEINQLDNAGYVAGGMHAATDRSYSGDVSDRVGDTLANAGNKVERAVGADLNADNDVGVRGTPYGQGMTERARDAVTDDQGHDTFRAADQAYDNSSKVGTGGGALAGAAAGAAIGSVGGPVGAVVGGTAGAITGAAAGAIGDTIGEQAETETGAFSDANKAQYRDTANRAENKLRDAGNTVERELGSDVDNDGDVGRRH
jgi:hypothetical protein